jgi:hypothetical protein
MNKISRYLNMTVLLKYFERLTRHVPLVVSMAKHCGETMK